MDFLTENTYLLVRYIPYLLAFWFLIIFLFAGRENRPHSFFLFVLFVVHIISFREINQCPTTKAYLIEYINLEKLMIRIDGTFAVILTMFIKFDRKAKYHALLLTLTVFTHFMLIYDLKEESTWFSNVVYDYCDEIIFTIGLLHLMVSFNGLTTALNKISLLLRGNDVYNICVNSSSSYKGK